MSLDFEWAPEKLIILLRVLKVSLEWRQMPLNGLRVRPEGLKSVATDF